MNCTQQSLRRLFDKEISSIMKKAILSVSDKTGIVPFAQSLVEAVMSCIQQAGLSVQLTKRVSR